MSFETTLRSVAIARMPFLNVAKLECGAISFLRTESYKEIFNAGVPAIESTFAPAMESIELPCAVSENAAKRPNKKTKMVL